MSQGMSYKDKAESFWKKQNLTIKAKLQGLNLEDCLESAYSVISKRTGSMIGGQFVKDE